MAKVKSPLQSYDASGQIGKSAVHFTWKGIHCIRNYVIPANPRTDAQIAVRADFTAAVAEWHLTQTPTLINTAWKRWIERIRKPWTTLNCFVGLRVKALQAGHIFTSFHTYALVEALGDRITFTFKGEETSIPRCYFGTKLTYTPRQTDGVWVPVSNWWFFDLTSLSTSTDYYFWVKAMQANNDTQSGMFKERTAAS